MRSNGVAFVVSTMQRVVPRLAFHLTRLRKVHDEPELKLLPLLVDPNREAIDVGANVGRYAYPLAKIARHVHAFEPHPRLARMLAASLPRNCSVRQEAVSDRPMTTTLRVPSVGGRWNEGLAHLDAQDDVGDVHEITVHAGTLDTLADRSIGFVKIDVEGHEQAVLRGAVQLLRRNRPVFLVEAENKHGEGGVQAVLDFFAAHDYRGLFLMGDDLRPVAAFRPEMQDTELLSKILSGGRRGDTPYINNFIFVPNEHKLRSI